MNTSLFGELLQTIAERGRALLDRGRDRHEMRRVLVPKSNTELAFPIGAHLLSARV
jgi:hypothetical protein